MKLPGKQTIRTAAICAAGAAVLFFPGSVFMLVLGAVLGFWGCTKIGQLSGKTDF